MIVQTYFPNRLSPARYDTYLASGWFRGSVMLYKMDLLCIEDDIFSVVNIRLKLDDHQFKKRHEKIMRKNDAKFKVVIRKTFSSTEKEELYQIQKKRFKGFIHLTLQDYLNSGLNQTVFNTYEVCIYDGSKLVAMSIFDMGNKSMASLLGMYRDEYSKYSLGIYTMLKELEFGMEWGMKYYYPGYILDKPSSFNYKLSLGNFEYYNNNKRWANFKGFKSESTSAYIYKSKMEEIGQAMDIAGIDFTSQLYPYFSMGYMGYWHQDFVKFPYFFKIKSQDRSSPMVMVSYDIDEKEYILAFVKESETHDDLINMEMADEFQKTDKYHLSLLEVNAIGAKSPEFEPIIRIINDILHHQDVDLQEQGAELLL